MKAFAEHVSDLEKLVEEARQTSGLRKRRSLLKPSLDGAVQKEFRSRVSLAARRASGAFFTGTTLARRLSRHLLDDVGPDCLIADPACGVGDLLLAAARALPVGIDLDETLQFWGSRLMGTDINPEFVRATKIRLLMLAISRLRARQADTPPAPRDLFPLIRECDYLARPETIADASHILVNPPYYTLPAPADCRWGSGTVSAAAVFMDKCLSGVCEGTRIRAILPDVLRSGSCYEKWRRHVESISETLRVSTYGQFDNFADVDVFVLELAKGKKKNRRKAIWWKSAKRAHAGRVGDYFAVHVGPVVPHRHPEEGPTVAYIHARTLPPWGVKARMNERRRFSGTLFKPPFVAVRRTSRPGEHRAVGTIITGKRSVAVENHVLVLLPHKKTTGECYRLLRLLRKRETDNWLNTRIRCRHLTVQAMQEIPAWSSEDG